MKCRRNAYDEFNDRHIVWFGSYGRNISQERVVEKYDAEMSVIVWVDLKDVASDSVVEVRIAKSSGTSYLDIRDINGNFVRGGSFSSPSSIQIGELEDGYKVKVGFELTATAVANPQFEIRYYRNIISAKFYNENDKHDNYSEKQQSLVDSLTQRLSVMKNELWYNITYGIPLFDKIRSKGVIDSYAISIVSNHPDVVNIQNFTSFINNHKYTCNIDILSKRGVISITI